MTSENIEILSDVCLAIDNKIINIKNVFELYGKYPYSGWCDLRVKQLLFCAEEIYRNEVKGSVAEAGVYKGDFAQYINAFFPGRKCYLFDSFNGFKNDCVVQGKDNVEECDECHGKGGFNPETCETCHGTGTVTSQRQTILGSFLSKGPCPDCDGKGKIYKQKCSECNGKGRIKKNKKITINIPAGVQTGDRQRISGKGNPGTNGGENGDLYLEYVVEEHDYYTRDNDDIYLEVPLTLTEAILGCKKTIPTLYGNVKLTVDAGTSSGEKQKIKGKGVNNEYRRHKGDMYVIFKVYTPKKLTREQKSLIEKLKDTDMTTRETNDFDKFVAKND